MPREMQESFLKFSEGAKEIFIHALLFLQYFTSLPLWLKKHDEATQVRRKIAHWEKYLLSIFYLPQEGIPREMPRENVGEFSIIAKSKDIVAHASFFSCMLPPLSAAVKKHDKATQVRRKLAHWEKYLLSIILFTAEGIPREMPREMQRVF